MYFEVKYVGTSITNPNPVKKKVDLNPVVDSKGGFPLQKLILRVTIEKYDIFNQIFVRLTEKEEEKGQKLEEFSNFPSQMILWASPCLCFY